ncbi:MAG: S9 family peptidase [Sphingobacteriaceae bacterium]|nr:MAG: S9 family peptidase [Sphingobacteriaceae bacterium]
MLLRNFKILLLAIAIITLQSCKDEKANQIPIDDFFKSGEKGSFKLAPNGKYLSYIKFDNFKTNLYIQSLADGKVSINKDLDKYHIADHSWTFDNRILLTCGYRDEDRTIYLYDLATSKVKHLLTENSKAKLRVLNRNRITPEIITLSMNKRDTTYADIFRLNINTGELKTYLINKDNISDWYIDIDGKIRLGKVTDGVYETFMYRANEGAKFKSIFKNDFRETVKWVAFKPQSNNFYAISNVGRDKSALVEINAITGKEEKVIYANDKADIQRAEYSRNKLRFDYAAWEDTKPKKNFLNPDAESIYTNLQKKLSGKEIAISEKDTAENKFIVSTYTDRSPGSVYLYELKKDKLTKLEDNSNINPDKLSEMKPIGYKATDGTTITGYLTLPKGGNQTNLPLVVIPHDGAFGNPLGSRNSWRYNGEVQFLANRGYAVLLVNYRGSSGFGKAFYNAGFKEIGGKIQQDITDGVNWLINKGIANPRKIAIMGRGFGGFLALNAVSAQPKLYSCAITRDGIINILSYIKDANQYKPSLERMYEMIGNPGYESDKLIKMSPVFHPEKIKVPLLIFQNDKDQFANISEINHFVSALQKRKVPVSYHLRKSDNKKPNAADFKFTNPNVERYTKIDSFLNVHMGNKK